MDLLKRLYNIARAELPLAEGKQDGAFREERDRAQDTTWRDRGSDGRGQDPVLAGYYANLELPYGSDIEAVRQSWKRLMKKYHPDMHSADVEKKKVADELSAELTRAYQELVRALSGNS